MNTDGRIVWYTKKRKIIENHNNRSIPLEIGIGLKEFCKKCHHYKNSLINYSKCSLVYFNQHLWFSKLKRRSTGENATASLPSDEGKDPPPKIRIEDSDKWLAGVLAPGRFPMQYYNRFGAKKSRRCELWSGQRRTSVQNV